MIYRDFRGEKLSLLGFGAMRLPLGPSGDNADIDQAQVDEMTAYAMEHGVNYYDTAYPYHGGKSEIAIAKALSAFPRESYNLADKYPGHQLAKKYDPAEIFEDQLKKTNAGYFDFYLLHNVNEFSAGTYLNPKWGIVDYFLEMKKQGKIRHLGFSCHGAPDCMREFLDALGDEMEFCQIQLNYLDWTLQNGAEKYALLEEYGIPVWTMESIRGGRLANLSPEDSAKLKALRPDASDASWALRWLINRENVGVILSGMSNLEQMKDNIATFENVQPLSQSEEAVLAEIAEGMKNSVPCTACRYCVAGCPMKLNIPALIALYNSAKFQVNFNDSMRLDSFGPEGQPSACIGCGRCARTCPQKIDVPQVMHDFAELAKTLPSWPELCRQREEAAERIRNAQR